MGDDAEAGQDGDVHLRMPEEPEQVLPESGDPPACGCSRSLTTSPAGMKKLVPATRSRISRTQAGSSTENAISPMTEVMNQAQVDERHPGERHPFGAQIERGRDEVERAQQLTHAEDRDRDRPERLPQPLPGPASLPTALSGA